MEAILEEAAMVIPAAEVTAADTVRIKRSVIVVVDTDPALQEVVIVKLEV